ncbi:type VI secretion system Vgr family protein [Novosphingobium bradum]|uniref:Type VI secretion system Vgr family protein n=1 Tax=Novosphingobium bradum TaxID=1737444 RepID=A0ABV7IV11_9SPHN
MAEHFLNLRELAGEPVGDYALLSFHGREAISEPYEYTIELHTLARPDLTKWIGQLAEFDVSPQYGQSRVFAGRIYAARMINADGNPRVQVSIGPAWQALAYTRGTQFFQDRTSIDILDAMTTDLTGYVKKLNVSPAPPARGYAVRFDESELAFLDRLLAHDGIMYFFEYDRRAGNFRNKMVITNQPADYIEVAGGAIHKSDGSLHSLERQFTAAPRGSSHASYNQNKLDQPFIKPGVSSASWGAVYSSTYDTLGHEAKAPGDLSTRATAEDQYQEQIADVVSGNSTEPTFCAGGRVQLHDAGMPVPQRVVLTSVIHSAFDGWALPDAAPSSYSNRFTAIDANRTWRPPVGQPDRHARGPVLGLIQDETSAMGLTIVDDQWRVPVKFPGTREFDRKGNKHYIWLPVQQQWAHSTHGAQFIPRIGTQVIVDFLYGNPDLPFVAGTLYNPAQPYPFDPTSTPTQTGWRSVTDGNGEIVQQFRFEDKPGKEEIYLSTDRDYRREIKHDDWGTVDNNQTLEVKKDRSRKVGGKETVEVTDTRTITVTGKNKLESMNEIELVVGPCSIKLTTSGIEIKAPQIKISADAKLEMQAGGQATLKAPMTQVNADATLILKGGMVLIN